MVVGKYVLLELCYLFLSEERGLKESLGNRKVRIEYLGDVCLSTVIRLRLTLSERVSL